LDFFEFPRYRNIEERSQFWALQLNPVW
jgi:hypothetical protein